MEDAGDEVDVRLDRLGGLRVHSSSVQFRYRPRFNYRVPITHYHNFNGVTLICHAY
jgi:hypothetical protein